MDWISGIQKAIDYIEEHLTEDVDYKTVASLAYSSSYHFQRVFSILSGITLGDYIRSRRLTLAGSELATSDVKVIDVALKYGYESPDSFSKAFQKFHGVSPSQARKDASSLKSFSRLSIELSLKGGSIMNYRVEEKSEMILTGYKRRFTGTPADRKEQENDFYVSTRANQYILKGLSHDCDTGYNVMTNFGDDGYDFYIASLLDEWSTNNLDKELGTEDAKRFEKITVPSCLYLVCETERCQYPTRIYDELRRKAVSEWMPSNGYELTDAPEVSVIHWFFKRGDASINNSRYIELWLPIKKK